MSGCQNMYTVLIPCDLLTSSAMPTSDMFLMMGLSQLAIDIVSMVYASISKNSNIKIDFKNGNKILF